MRLYEFVAQTLLNVQERANEKRKLCEKKRDITHAYSQAELYYFNFISPRLNECGETYIYNLTEV